MDKQTRKKYNSEYFHNNKEYHYQRQKKFRDENPEKVKLYRIKQKKNNTKSQWKKRGLIGDYDEIYLRYDGTKVCDNCNVVLEGCCKNQKCMDHDHITGEFRNILCKSCNIKKK